MFKLLKRDHATHEPIEITVSTRTVLRVLALVFGFILFIAALRVAGPALLILFSAFFLALALNGPVVLLARYLPGKLRFNRTVGTALVFAIGALLLAGFLASVVPLLVRQTQGLADRLPSIISDFQNHDGQISQFISQYRLEGQLDSLSSQLADRVRAAGGSAITTIGKIGSSIFTVVSILVLSFMMLTEGPRILEFLRELIPKKRRPDAERLAHAMYKVIRGFVNGQVTLAALAAIVLLPGLLILHVSYPIALVFVVFICGLIPMVGHTIGAIIVGTVALFTSLPSALLIVLYYFCYQQLENYFVQPRIQANSTDLSPLLVFGSVIVGVMFGGLVGGLFAIPVAGCIRVAVLDWLVRRSYINPVTAPVVEESAAKVRA